ncbi:MAG: FAD-dependent oxidoreductase [Bacteroidetes bacterium]|nr:FAD-dependent oxidoreductase [Bacteroidota bacterium]
MQQKISIKITPSEAASNSIITAYIAAHLSINENQVTGFYKIKESIDARSRHQIWINITLQVFIDEPFITRQVEQVILRNVNHNSKSVIIIGAGPAGLFAALKLLELGIKPIVLERGKNVRDRRRDLAKLNKEGIVNPESNYCFGEGGAGTYSDGKLYTRSNKRGNIDRILNLFVQFGADEKILYQAHPHIGTNKLPNIIAAMRDAIIAYGGEVIFEEKVIDFVVKQNEIESVITSKGNNYKATSIILATGHSARDIFKLLHHKNILIEAKPFALGVRIEHPQNIIDECQYHLNPIATKNVGRGDYLPAASYSLVEQVNRRGVFSFCMCPGGIIAAAATDTNELVVNGWSPSKRNNPYANSGMVVTVELKNVLTKEITANPLALLEFQKNVEQKAYTAGGGNLVAPALRMVDFCEGKISTNLPNCSYIPGVTSANLKTVLPSFIHQALQQGLKTFGKKMKGYYTNEAIVVATESRTSSPVRIPRNADNLQHPQITNLYPCAEGAGYAGGIVSAAMDGERVAEMIVAHF